MSDMIESVQSSTCDFVVFLWVLIEIDTMNVPQVLEPINKPKG